MEKVHLKNTNPFDTLTKLAGGYCVARCLHIVAELGIADHLDGTPRKAIELANTLGLNPDALDRMLRLLASHEIFQVEGEAFGHSQASRLLRSDHPQSMRAFTRLFGLPVFWRIYEGLDFSLQTGLPAADKVVPAGLWTYFSTQPEANKIFNAAMVAKASGHIAGIMAVYDFSGFKTIADIGGGRGHLLRAILEAVPAAKGILFDLPNVIAEAANLASDRFMLQTGDFFKDPIPACDAYLLMEIIHDWPDKESLDILKAIRQAAPPHARLLLIEQMISEEPGPHWSKMLDIHMLALLGGRQRSLPEYQNLLESAGFRLEREIPTFADISILEATCI